MPFLRFNNRHFENFRFSETDSIELVVPAKFSTPQIKKRAGNKFKLCWWNQDDFRGKSRTFASLEEAISEKQVMMRSYCRSQIIQVSGACLMANVAYFEKYFRFPLPCKDYEELSLPLDPYIVGIWLGDGSTGKPAITSVDEVVIAAIYEVAKKLNLLVRQNKITYTLHRPSGECSKTVSWDILENAFKYVQNHSMCRTAEVFSISRGTLAKYLKLHNEQGIQGVKAYLSKFRSNGFIDGLSKWGIIRDKHIPQICALNSRSIRLALLAGIIDSDGSLNCGGYDMLFCNKKLATNVADLARSLGFFVTFTETTKVCYNSKLPRPVQAWRFRISGGDNLRDIPIRIKRKVILSKAQRYDQLRFSVQK